MASKDKSFSNQARRNGFSATNGFTQVGFVVPSIDANQVAFTCITNCNRWLVNNFGMSFSVFYDKEYAPCIDPLFPRFHLADALGFEGHLIATSMSAALNIKTATKSRRYYYIYDLEWLRRGYTFSKEQTESILANDEIIKFARAKDHVEEIKKAGCTKLHGVVEDFNIEQIMEIING